MQGSWLDHLPSRERMKIRERLRSPEEYERLREKVKGPEDLEREMRWSEAMAELSFALETEPKVQEALKNQVEGDLAERGIEEVLENSDQLSPEAKRSLEQGTFSLKVEAHPTTHVDQLMAVPEGRVQEKIPVRRSMSEQYVAQLLATAPAEKMITIAVLVDGAICGYLDIGEKSSEADVLDATLSRKLVQNCLRGRTVMTHFYQPRESLNLLTG